MAAQLGRTLGLQLDTTGSGSYQTIASLRTKSLKISNEDVDVTTGDSANQWRELLANAGVKSMEISFAGLFDDAVPINLVNTFFRDKLEGVPTIREYIRAMQEASS